MLGCGVDIDRGPPSIPWGLRLPPARDAARRAIRWRYSSPSYLLSHQLDFCLPAPGMAQPPYSRVIPQPCSLSGHKICITRTVLPSVRQFACRTNHPSQQLRLYTSWRHMSTIAPAEFFTARRSGAAKMELPRAQRPDMEGQATTGPGQRQWRRKNLPQWACQNLPSRVNNLCVG